MTNEARKPNLIQLQERAIEQLLSVKPAGLRGSGALQARQRRAARKQYERGASGWGFDAAQIEAQWKQVNEMVELRRNAEPLEDLTEEAQEFYQGMERRRELLDRLDAEGDLLDLP